jgi:hypothetical protein
MVYLLLLFFLGLFLFALFFWWQHRVVFSPVHYRDEDLDERCQFITLYSTNNSELEGVVYEPNNPKNTLLYFGGRSQDSVGLIKKLSISFKHTRIITFNYRSYGNSKGKISEKRLLDDAKLIGVFVDENYGNFYILGFSLGSNIAAYLAKELNPLGVFLVGAFDSLVSLAKNKHLPNSKIPPKILFPFFRYKFNTVKYMQELQTKVYLFVSKDDEVTFIENSRNLHKHIKNLQIYKEYSSLSHNELLWDEDLLQTIKKVLE